MKTPWLTLISRERTRQGITIEAMAEKLGISKYYWVEMETGRKSIPADLLFMVMDILSLEMCSKAEMVTNS